MLTGLAALLTGLAALLTGLAALLTGLAALLTGLAALLTGLAALLTGLAAEGAGGRLGSVAGVFVILGKALGLGLGVGTVAREFRERVDGFAQRIVALAGGLTRFGLGTAFHRVAGFAEGFRCFTELLGRGLSRLGVGRPRCGAFGEFLAELGRALGDSRGPGLGRFFELVSCFLRFGQCGLRSCEGRLGFLALRGLLLVGARRCLTGVGGLP